MKLQHAIKASRIAELTGGQYTGPDDLVVTGINEIHKVTTGDVTFVDVPRYYDKVLKSAATLILINKKTKIPEGKGIIVCKDPFDAYNLLVQNFAPSSGPPEGDSAVGRNTTVHPEAVLWPGVVLGNNVTIGKGAIIYPGVTIYDNVSIGKRVIIHANTTIGADAFYFKKRENGYDKLLTCGSVVIENDVEIGANCTIDRGVSGETRIGAGSKLDNQVHLGHGVILGKNCLLAGQVGVGGKAIIEDNVTIWGQVGVSKDLRIASGVELLAQSGVPSSIVEPGRYFGSPAGKASEKMREVYAVKALANKKGKSGDRSSE